MIKRNIQLNILLMLSSICFALSFLSENAMETIEKNTTDFLSCNCFTALSQWGIPLLIMTVGCVYLRGEYSFSLEALSVIGYITSRKASVCQNAGNSKDIEKTKFRNLILRSVISCVLIWFFVALVYISAAHKGEYDIDTLFECMARVLKKPYYISFYQLVVMLFVFYPLIKRIMSDRKLTTYAAALFFLIAVLNRIISFVPYLNYLYMFTSQLNWNNFTVYGFYLFLGGLLYQTKLKWYFRMLVYLGGIMSSSVIYYLNILSGVEKPDKDLVSALILILSAVQACAVFEAVKSLSEKLSPKLRVGLFIDSLSENVFIFIPVFICLYYSLRNYINLSFLPFSLEMLIELIFYYTLALTFCYIIRRIPKVKYLTT